MSRPKRLSALTCAGAAALLALLQLLPAERSTPPSGWEVDAPAEVLPILRRSCFDCHSRETRWPWYSRVAPISWWIAGHVEDARKDLDFSRWPAFDDEARRLALRSIEEQVRKGEMPLKSYLILHPGARLDEDERAILVRWARSAL